MDLEIIIKTCDSNTLSPLPRIYDGKKIDIIKKCLNSVVLSAGQSDKQIKITVVDDASSPECVEMIQKILSRSFKKTEFIKREKNDFREATLNVFEIARDSEATLVYCVEDDYLHEPNAIQEMISFYDHAFNQLNKTKDVVVCPFDDPSNYNLRFHESAYVVMGERRHWRTNGHTTCTFMTVPSLVRKNWNTFEDLANNFGNEKNEMNSIDYVWRLPSTVLFTPLPSIAFHIHDEQRADRLVAWKELWDYVPDLTATQNA